MARKLNSDQLGKKGESRFPELCTDAGLIPNPSTWDRKGWDFVVDWPMTGMAPFDSRPTAFSCLVQLKTVWFGAPSVRLRLSSLEHLAKDLKPSFLFVLEVDDSLNFVGARVAHLEGELLGAVLKALREATIKGIPPNKVAINLKLDAGFETIAPTGLAARAAFERAIGASMATYALDKQKQLQGLGFADDRLTMKTTLQFDDEDEILDAFLGLRKLSVVSIEAIETRFGLALPHHGMGTIGRGELEITPQSFDRCEVVGRDTVDGREFRFHGDIYGLPAPMLTVGQFRFLIRTPMFSLLIGGQLDDRMSVKISLNLEIERIAKLKVSAVEWGKFYGFLAAIGRNQIEITMKFGKAERPIVGTVMTQIDQFRVDQWAAGERISAAAKRTLCAAGWPSTKLSLQTLVDTSTELELLDAIINRPGSVSPMNFTTAASGGEIVAQSTSTEILYIGLIDLHRHFLVYAAVIDLVSEPAGEQIRWIGSNFRFRDVARIKATELAYRRFIADTQRCTGIQSYFARGTPGDEQANEA